MTPGPVSRSASPKHAWAWAIGVVAAGLLLVLGFWGCFTSLTARGELFDFERDLPLFGPYLLSGINILLAPEYRKLRTLAVVLLGLGLVMGGLVLGELVIGIVQTGQAPAMLASAFLGAAGLLVQYFLSSILFLVLSITRLASMHPPTDQTEDYAD